MGSHVDHIYQNIVKRVLNYGYEKSPVRKNNEGKWEPVDGGVKTLACPNVHFSYEMSNGFPILTTKKIAWKTLKVELEGFIKGITDKSWYQDRKCKIWNEWANPTVVDSLHESERNFDPITGGILKSKKQLASKEQDLGPIYGYQWRSFNQAYDSLDNGNTTGTDQLANIVETLRTNPMDRRMVCSAWNPNQIHMMALPPCHYSWNVTVIGNKLNLFWAQRSADLMLGVPFNIASYGLLLSLLAKDAGLEVGNLSAVFVDCHIYENQKEGALEQVVRIPRDTPDLIIEGTEFDIFDWTHENATLTNYNPHDAIKFGDVVV